MLSHELAPPKRAQTVAQAQARYLLAVAVENCTGRRGQSEFAELLHQASGRPVVQAQVSQWMTGSHPVPEWAEDALAGVYELTIRTMDQRVANLREGARLLGIRHLARTAAPADEAPDDDPAP